MSGRKRAVCGYQHWLRRSLWVRENDVVIVEPWELGGNEKGDVVHKLTAKRKWLSLKRKGTLRI